MSYLSHLAEEIRREVSADELPVDDTSSLFLTYAVLMLGLADGLVGESTRKQKGIGADILILDLTASGAWSGG